MIIKIITVTMLGCIVGYFLERMTLRLISNRITESVFCKFSGTKLKTASWAIANGCFWMMASYFGGVNLKALSLMLIFSVCLVLSAVDITIKKIPNETLLVILVAGAVFIASNGKGIGLNLIGFAVGFIMFLLPAYIGKAAGLGDVKFAAAAGFCLGVYDFLTAVIIMTVVLFGYFLYLHFTGKGTLKSKVALGPFLASGMVAVMILQLLSSKYMLMSLSQLIAK